MANVVDINPVVITDTGLIRAKATKIKSIAVRASGDTWAVELHDAENGNLIYSRAQDITNDRGCHDYMGGVKVAGIWATTLTDITKVTIWLDEV